MEGEGKKLTLRTKEDQVDDEGGTKKRQKRNGKLFAKAMVQNGR